MIPTAEQYAEQIADVLYTGMLTVFGIERIQHESHAFPEVQSTATHTGIVLFSAGEELDVDIHVDSLNGWPVLDVYRIHLQDRDHQCIVRYDNTPHHREIETFPNHKHVGPGEDVQPFHFTNIRSIAHDLYDHFEAHRKTVWIVP